MTNNTEESAPASDTSIFGMNNVMHVLERRLFAGPREKELNRKRRPLLLNSFIYAL